MFLDYTIVRFKGWKITDYLFFTFTFFAFFLVSVTTRITGRTFLIICIEGFLHNCLSIIVRTIKVQILRCVRIIKGNSISEYLSLCFSFFFFFLLL